ncbi:hypothetical protein F4859DRAFT_486756 [Xylaria cf. heliscus]|nr:hypothetical protein F4859DRAFT_486756 [Xylaria cf. heliscus]
MIAYRETLTFPCLILKSCCIDKSSSSELSEAINSMFQWYANAHVCYVYLSDVEHLPNATEDEVKSSLANSRWITRGWTLQELIAPPHVVFYSKDWQVCGTRSKFSAILAEITLIDEPYLTGRPLDDASVAQRMSWAAKRTTSRVEDQAYCLLGIFNVNMSLIYGEKSKAFRRLQEAISHEYPEDHSLYAWGKIVSQFSYAVRDNNHIWGSEPIEYDPSLTEQRLFGLFAGSPADFINSGQIVRAPLAIEYFEPINQLRSPPVSIGRATQVEFPIMPWVNYAAFHIKNPPIVQLRSIRYALLLCGHWDKSQDQFSFILIPEVVIGNQMSRTNEIVTTCNITPSVEPLHTATQRYIYRLPRPYRPQHGGILFRRVVSNMDEVHTHGDTVCDVVRLQWLNPVGLPWGMLHAIAFEADKTHYMAVFLQRHGPLSSENPKHDDVEKGGKLSVGLAPFNIISNSTLPLRTPEVQNTAPSEPPDSQNSEAAKGTKESFSSNHEGISYFWFEPEEIPYQHEMEAPRDEWRLSLAGYVDIYISVERMYIESDDADDDIIEQGSESFVDIVDLVVRVKGDPGYKEPGDCGESCHEVAGNADVRSDNTANY